MAFQYTSGKPLPPRPDFVAPGNYPVRILEALPDVSAAKNDVIELKLEVLTGDETKPGPIVYDTLVFVANSVWKIDQLLRAAGRELNEGDNVELEPDDLVGLVVSASLYKDTYKEKTKNKVKGYAAHVAEDDVPF